MPAPLRPNSVDILGMPDRSPSAAAPHTEPFPHGPSRSRPGPSHEVPRQAPNTRPLRDGQAAHGARGEKPRQALRLPVSPGLDYLDVRLSPGRKLVQSPVTSSCPWGDVSREIAGGDSVHWMPAGGRSLSVANAMGITMDRWSRPTGLGFAGWRRPAGIREEGRAVAATLTETSFVRGGVPGPQALVRQPSMARLAEARGGLQGW